MTCIKALNHVALHVRDVPKSVVFYSQIIGLEQIPRPKFDFDGAWFRIGTTQELHLIGGLDYIVQSGSRKNHFALWVDRISDITDSMKMKEIVHSGPKQRPDGIWQLFVQDPDGHWIEFTSDVL